MHLKTPSEKCKQKYCLIHLSPEAQRCCPQRHSWSGNVIFVKFSLAALEVNILKTSRSSGTANDENFIKMTFLFQCTPPTTIPVLTDGLGPSWHPGAGTKQSTIPTADATGTCYPVSIQPPALKLWHCPITNAGIMIKDWGSESDNT